MPNLAVAEAVPNLAVAEASVPKVQSALKSVPTGTIFTADTVTSASIWTIWNTSTQSASITSGNTNAIWTTWVGENNSTGVLKIGNGGTGTIRIPNNSALITSSDGNAIWGVWVRSSNLTKEQEQVLLLRNEEANQRRIVMEAEQARARDRAEKLLHESLDAKQKAELAANGYFELEVISKNGERRKYRIHRKWSHSIHQIDPSNGQRLKTLCIHPREAVPVADSMLAQKLMLEGGMEEDLLRIANHS